MRHALEALRRFMREEVGVRLGPEKDYLLHSRLERVLRDHQLSDLPALARHLAGDPAGPLARDVISALTTHETSWFRDGRPFERLRDEVLPSLRAEGARPLSFWSAACASGQEAYSIAITLREAGLPAPGWPASLLASDVCERAVAQAAGGCYGEFDIGRGLGSVLRERYFSRQDECWRVEPVLRRLVEFRVLNLLRLPAALGPFDAVFCRNVLIYFGRTHQKQVLDSVSASLRPGGYLFLGTAESPLGLCDDFLPLESGSGLYRKRLS